MQTQVKTCGSLQYILRYPKNFTENEKINASALLKIRVSH